MTVSPGRGQSGAVLPVSGGRCEAGRLLLLPGGERGSERRLERRHAGQERQEVQVRHTCLSVLPKCLADLPAYLPDLSTCLSVSRYVFTSFKLCWAELAGVRVRVPCTTLDYVRANYGHEAWSSPETAWDWKTSPANVMENGVWPRGDWGQVIQSY